MCGVSGARQAVDEWRDRVDGVRDEGDVGESPSLATFLEGGCHFVNRSDEHVRARKDPMGICGASVDLGQTGGDALSAAFSDTIV